MKGLGVRVAKAINEHHTGRRHTDPHYLVFDGFSSEAWPNCVAKPRSWLLNNAWRGG